MTLQFKDPLAILFNVSSLNIPTFKISKSKKGLFYQEGLNEALRDVMEHQISLRKSSKDNGWESYVDRSKKQKHKVVVLWENIRWLPYTGALLDI